jgi:sugar/nucleoside kinase (ribokinase family)
VSDFDYVTVGHVTVDVMCADGARRPGGGAFYSALQAARLGARTLIVTKGAPAEIEELLAPYREEVELEVHPAQQTTTLVTAGMGSERRQRLVAWAGAMTEPIAVDTSILHLTAVARETPRHWQGRAEFVGITPQGWMREWDAAGEMAQVPLDPKTLPRRWDALAISEVERPWCEQLIAASSGVIAVTAGSAPTSILLSDGSVQGVAVPPVAHPLDDLGAGDVFAAAFFIALGEGRRPVEAAAYGNAAAAVRIASVGPGAVGDRAAIAAAPRQ